jgi:hypothetical protein
MLIYLYLINLSIAFALIIFIFNKYIFNMSSFSLCYICLYHVVFINVLLISIEIRNWINPIMMLTGSIASIIVFNEYYIFKLKKRVDRT